MTVLLLALSLLNPAHAGSLDLLEVGGAWGSPGATNPTAIWWNPAGMAVGGGTQFLIEGAPTLASVDFNRAAVDYGPDGDLTTGGSPNPLDIPYDYSGAEKIKFGGLVPFVGIQSDFGVDGLAVGGGLAVPFALGGQVGDDPPTYDDLLNDKAGPGDYAPSPGSFFLRDGDIRAIYLMLGAGYHIADKVAIGVSGSVVDSSWYAVVDVETLSSLKQNGGNLVDYSDTEQLFEDPNYRSTLHFDTLRDRVFTFGAGIYLTPTDDLGISVAYNHGFRVDNDGDVMVTTGCPPDDDVIGRLGVEALGLCNQTTPGTSTVGYNLPSRIHGGVVYDGVDRLRLEAMGGWVGWSVFTDYDIQTRVKAEDVPDAADPDISAELISQDRKWARDNQDNFWVGIDGKGEVVADTLTLGGRFIFDSKAVPDSALASNNFDSNRLNFSGMAAVGPFGPIKISASVGHQIYMTRTTDSSAFSVSWDTVPTPPDRGRTFYPSSNGEYKGRVTRVGIGVMGAFGKAKDGLEAAE